MYIFLAQFLPALFINFINKQIDIRYLFIRHFYLRGRSRSVYYIKKSAILDICGTEEEI